MRWVYGKQDWKTLERGQENCYLMTNGLGGFSSLTMTGSAARNDHAFLILCPVCVQGGRCRGGAGVPVRGQNRSRAAA